jgi:hypothetical protein
VAATLERAYSMPAEVIEAAKKAMALTGSQ